jgi:hypothetical protein
MNTTDTAQPGADTPLSFHPQHAPIDLAFAASVPAYRDFVYEWRALYRWLSATIRHDKLVSRAAESERAKPKLNVKPGLLRALAGKCKPAGPPPAAYAATWRLPHWQIRWSVNDRDRYGDRAYANYLLALRADAKRAFKARDAVLTPHEV